MKMTRINRALLFVVCMVLIAATALFATGCGNNASETAEPTTVTMENGAVLGEGAKQFTFTVVDGEGNETTATINSDADTVGEALQALKLIAGEPGEYGLYVKEVTGIRAVYEESKTPDLRRVMRFPRLCASGYTYKPPEKLYLQRSGGVAYAYHFFVRTFCRRRLYRRLYNGGSGQSDRPRRSGGMT